MVWDEGCRYGRARAARRQRGRRERGRFWTVPVGETGLGRENKELILNEAFSDTVYCGGEGGLRDSCDMELMILGEGDGGGGVPTVG